jgi:urease accessory protein
VDVGAHAAVQLTSTGATRVYRCRRGASQAIGVTVGEGATLEYVPDALIPFAGARYRQVTRIELAPDAGLFWWEVVAPGREARGELFAYDLLELDFEIATCGRPIAIERSSVEPQARPPASLARLGPFHYWACFYICRVGVEARRWVALEGELQGLAESLTRPAEALWAVGALSSDGLAVRALAISGRYIGPGLERFWRAASLALYGREPVPPRKLQ